MTDKADVLIVTVTKEESQAVMKVFHEAAKIIPKLVSIGDRIYHDLGEINTTRVFMALSEMGSSGLGGANESVRKGIEALSPNAIIMVGIAFGVNEEKQAIGDILVSEQLKLYDLQHVGTSRKDRLEIIPRGDKPHASTWLFNRFQSADLYWDESIAKVRFGVVLSGDKLVDNFDYREQLKNFEPEAIGGEMEGVGMYVAAQDKKVDWILVKGICDWADGNKSNPDKVSHQQTAAHNAASFVLHVLQQAPLKLEGDRPEPVAQTPVLHKNTTGILKEWLNTTVRIRMGDYYTLEASSPMRIEVTDIRTALIPDKYSKGTEERLAVELDVGLGGALVYGGARTVKVNVNKYLVPRVEFHESAESIYAFYTTDHWFSFFRISVTHINSHDRCADVSIVSLSVFVQ